MIKLKTYVISDIHGHYDAMVSSLKRSGYNSKDKTHQLIVLGDLFDRGLQNKEVYDYLFKLSLERKASIILGNHDKFLIDFLEGNHKKTVFNIARNGFGTTIDSFLGEKHSNIHDFNETSSIVNTKNPKLLKWLKSFPLFLEIEEYIFVHGGVNPTLDDWRKTSLRDFVWSYEYELDKIQGRIVVAGHHRVSKIRNKQCTNYHNLFATNKELFDILYLDGKVLIDRYVEVTNELNVLVLELPKLKETTF